MTQAVEERREKQKHVQKSYRDRMSPEQKEKVAQSKKKSALKYKEKTSIERKHYYEKNKEDLNAKSRAYHQKKRDEIKALRNDGKEYAHLVVTPKPRKVIPQPSNMTTLKEEAVKMGITLAHLRAMQRKACFNMPAFKILMANGTELYDVYELAQWQQTYRAMIGQETISGTAKHKGSITLDKKVMLVISWLQASKHVTEYCNAQRAANNSKDFWLRYA